MEFATSMLNYVKLRSLLNDFNAYLLGLAFMLITAADRVQRYDMALL
jgi:IS4 transposase